MNKNGIERFSEETKELSKKLRVWLHPYTQEVYEKVMGQMPEILKSEMAMHLLTELYNREMKELAEEESTIAYDLSDNDGKFTHIHLHCLEHSSSYRDVLYDLYIR